MELGLKGNPPAGILLIDKPSGITSHDVVYRVRKKTGVKRVGHAGTLDPLATGLLIVLVSREFTKKQDQFMKQDKEYLCEAQLGIETDTYDIQGKVIRESSPEITQDVLEKILDKFMGKIIQTVPAFSAVKVKGEKLYNKARKGEIEKKDLPSREVEIKRLELVDFNDSQQKFSLIIECSSGTYIRSLVHDMGQEIGVGATITSLRRTKIGSYSIEQALDLESFVA